MIEACRAVVRPRVVSPETGDVVLLEDEVAIWLEGDSRTLRIVGGPGSGKTTAIRHLGAVFGNRTEIILIDDGNAAPENILLDSRRLIYSAPAGLPDCEDPTLRLASWNQDDLLEYCLAQHRQHCASIMERIAVLPDARRLHGIPQLWTLVIDAFAADEAVGDWRSVLKKNFAGKAPEIEAAVVRHWCLCELLSRNDKASLAIELLEKRGWQPKELPWIRHRAPQTMLAAAHVLDLLKDHRAPFFLEYEWPGDLVAETAALLTDEADAWRRLLHIIADQAPRYHPTAATLLHAMGQGWQPPRTRANLAGAVFTGAVWPGIDLSKAELSRADLSDAELSKVRLDNAQAQEINLSRARMKQASLRGVSMRGAMLEDADLTKITSMNSAWQHADFHGAKLRGANLYRADLQHADFTDADLTNGAFLSAQLSGAKLDRTNCSGADFRNARLKWVNLSTAVLDGARFERADLEEANLENLHWPAAALRKVNLTRAYLTGSVMPGANLQGATLCEAGLADIDWEGADLRAVDFSNCAFHLGSSRSGLVGSPIACEGSRTGFYTDDYLEQDFKSPEEIRKANLCGADLRGAIVDRADFYLVDLRGARYNPQQAEHFRRCGAILVDRVQRR